jgi:hypothetical protein
LQRVTLFGSTLAMVAGCGSTPLSAMPRDAGSHATNDGAPNASSRDAAVDDASVDAPVDLDGDDEAGPNGPNCPMSTSSNPIPIVQHSACTVPGTVCAYPATYCVCKTVDAGSPEWQCTHIIQ